MIMFDPAYEFQKAVYRGEIELPVYGGAGSGNFGHTGRPGKRGGSAADSGSSTGARGTTKLKSENVIAMGFYLESYQKIALKEGRHELIKVPVKKAYGKEYDQWGGLKDEDYTVKSMRQTIKDGYRLPVLEGSIQPDGRVLILDGQHRLLAQKLERGISSSVPVLVLKG